MNVECVGATTLVGMLASFTSSDKLCTRFFKNPKVSFFFFITCDLTPSIFFFLLHYQIYSACKFIAMIILQGQKISSDQVYTAQDRREMMVPSGPHHRSKVSNRQVTPDTQSGSQLV